MTMRSEIDGALTFIADRGTFGATAEQTAERFLSEYSDAFGDIAPYSATMIADLDSRAIAFLRTVSGLPHWYQF